MNKKNFDNLNNTLLHFFIFFRSLIERERERACFRSHRHTQPRTHTFKFSEQFTEPNKLNGCSTLVWIIIAPGSNVVWSKFFPTRNQIKLTLNFVDKTLESTKCMKIWTLFRRITIMDYLWLNYHFYQLVLVPNTTKQRILFLITKLSESVFMVVS